MTPRSFRKFHVLAVLAQAAAAVIPCLWLLQLVPVWLLMRSATGSDSFKPEVTAASLLALFAFISLVGLQLGKCWGWTWALLANMAATLVLALDLISGSRPPHQLAVCFALLLTASAVMMLPGVRAYYSQQTLPWPLTWWQRKRENEREQVVRVAFAIGQLAASLSGLILLLAFLPYAQFVALLPFGILGIIASVKLFMGHRIGVLLTLAWAALGLLAIAERGHSAPLRGSVLWLAVFLLVNGFYASAMLARRLAHQLAAQSAR